MRPIPDGPVFSREQARALGWSDSALTRAVAGGRLLRVRRGVFAPIGSAGGRVPIIAAAQQLADSVVSHRSALVMLDLPVVGPLAPVPELTVGPHGRGSARAAHLHRASLPSDDVVVVDGVLVTSAARTVVDIARQRPLATAVAAVDAALHRGLTTYDELDAVVLRCWNWPGIRRVHRAIRLSDGRSESPLESVSRLVVRRLGLPRPLLQPLLLDEFHRPVARLDFYWDEFGVAGEADGRSKYDDRPVLVAKKERQESGEDLAVVFTRWGWSATRRPQLLRLKLERAFERGRARDRSSFPRVWSISPARPVGREEDSIEGRPTAGRPRAWP